MAVEHMTPAEIKNARGFLNLSVQGLADALKMEGDNAADRIRSWERGKQSITGPASVAIKLLVERKEHGDMV